MWEPNVTLVRSQVILGKGRVTVVELAVPRSEPGAIDFADCPVRVAIWLSK